MSVSVQIEDFDIAAEIDTLISGRTNIGAAVTFTGLVRDMASDVRITEMTLEHYPGMTEKSLQNIVEQAISRWSLDGCRVVHRYGRLLAGERIVLVITLSKHRQDAFDAAEYVMDYLKSRAPFWKKEGKGGDASWVDARDSDEVALDRWDGK